MIGWAWDASKKVDRNWRIRIRFVFAALTARSCARRLRLIDADTPLGSLLSEWPDTVGYLLWPYQCVSWGCDERIRRIDGHFDFVGQFPGLRLNPNEKLVIADLNDVSPNARLVLDRAKWLSREGHLTLSLFKGEFRAFTISFSLMNGSDLEMFIGGVQGRQGEEILSLYRDLTKDFEGMRPRDFMLEALRMFATSIGVRHMYGVVDAQKISHHAYFGKKGTTGLFYDDIWQERGGLKVAETHYELPMAGSRKAIDEIPSKKRSMYRRRYEMLDAIAEAIPRDLTKAERRQFEAK